MNRVLLLTDGLANVGITDRDELIGLAYDLRRRGVSTSTFGVGTDFDEGLLQGMADAGGGHFYFIGDVAQMRDHITSEVGETLEVVAREVVLELTLPESVRVDSLSPFRVERRGGRALVYLGDMVSGQVLSIVLRVTFDYGEVGREVGVGVRVSDRDGAFERGRSPASTRSRSPGPTPTTPPTTPSRGTGTWTASSRGCSPSGRSRRPSRSTARASTTRRAGRSRASGSAIAAYAGSDPELRRIVAELREAGARLRRRRCRRWRASSGTTRPARRSACGRRTASRCARGSLHRAATAKPGSMSRASPLTLAPCARHYGRVIDCRSRWVGVPCEVARRNGGHDRMSIDRPGAARPLLRRAAPPAPDGTIVEVTVDSAGWEFADIAAYRLRPGSRVGPPRRRPRAARARARGPRRACGPATSTSGPSARGPRCSTARRAPVVLVAPGRPFDLVAETRRARRRRLGARAARCGRPGCIAADDILVEARGSGQTARRIHHLLPPGAEAGRLIAYEVFTPGGNWSSYPPHKHDTEDPPVEARLEEIYFYRFAKPQGFAFQRVYTPDRSLDEAMTPGDGDVVLVPRGYHPVGVPAGYDCYYLNVMAGPEPRLALHDRSRPRVADGLEPGGTAGGTGGGVAHDAHRGRQPAPADGRHDPDRLLERLVRGRRARVRRRPRRAPARPRTRSSSARS